MDGRQVDRPVVRASSHKPFVMAYCEDAFKLIARLCCTHMCLYKLGVEQGLCTTAKLAVSQKPIYVAHQSSLWQVLSSILLSNPCQRLKLYHRAEASDVSDHVWSQLP